ncbi:alpha/beta hydrolase [Massilia sp. YIM B02769]|uniref:alpha/beta fold hydrolase n=1 Tax=Massilia sp. YIM B02769 TaxID=3050129 RepID=UPI0025B6AC20|nr:alpha/beta hydrolase [Massilia sp. YIM B02769]MDN4057832.1 alpha/beta hydrolase [Massilia sp. YIM B02769]
MLQLPKLTEKTFDLVDEMKIPATSYPLVLLPGFMLDETLWDEVVPLLQWEAPVHRLPLGPGTTTEEIARSVAAAAPERFVLVGFSLGGYIARKVAELFPERVVALVLVASSLESDTPERAKAKQDAIRALDPSTFRGLSTGSIAQSLHPDRRGDRELVTRIREMGRRLGYEAMVVQSGLQRDGIAAASLRCPTLVIGAGQDSLRSMQKTKELAEAIPGAILKMIEQSGHMLPLEQPNLLAITSKIWLFSQSNA